jgi:hypothetical protein
MVEIVQKASELVKAGMKGRNCFAAKAKAKVGRADEKKGVGATRSESCVVLFTRHCRTG